MSKPFAAQAKAVVNTQLSISIPAHSPPGLEIFLRWHALGVGNYAR